MNTTLVLHPYSLFRVKEQAETKLALETVRNHFPVVDKCCSRKDDYDCFLKLYWGKETVVTVEQDIVPSVEMIQSLNKCPFDWCLYEYEVRYLDNHNSPYTVNTGLGFAKFSVKAQQISTPEKWFKLGDWNHFNLDCRIADPLIQAGLQPHIHGEVKHNRVVDWTGAT